MTHAEIVRAIQASNQEEDTAQYKVGVMKRDDEDEVFAVDF